MVCPACAGMIRSCEPFASGNNCLPRMRGDDPFAYLAIICVALFAPHARG